MPNSKLPIQRASKTWLPSASSALPMRNDARCRLVILIPRLGIEGAAVATSTALVAESTMLYLVAKRRLGFHVFIMGDGQTP